MNNTRKIIAATVLGLLGGAAIAEERQIDYTNQHLTMTRAEVVADTYASGVTHHDVLGYTNEAYGRTSDAATMWAGIADDAVVADMNNSHGFDFRSNEAYGGFPVVDDRQGRGE